MYTSLYSEEKTRRRRNKFKIQSSENKEQRTENKEQKIPLRYACGMENNVETQRAASEIQRTKNRKQI